MTKRSNIIQNENGKILSLIKNIALRQHLYYKNGTRLVNKLDIPKILSVV